MQRVGGSRRSDGGFNGRNHVLSSKCLQKSSFSNIFWLLEPPGMLWDAPGAFWDALGRSWSLLGRSAMVLEPPGVLWDAPGASWNALGPFWTLLGCSGTLLDPPGMLWDASGASWNALGRSWSLLGCSGTLLEPVAGGAELWVVCALCLNSRSFVNKLCALPLNSHYSVPNPCTLALNSYLGCSWLLQAAIRCDPHSKYAPENALRARLPECSQIGSRSSPGPGLSFQAQI